VNNSLNSIKHDRRIKMALLLNAPWPIAPPSGTPVRVVSIGTAEVRFRRDSQLKAAE
jgi:hypothetical protein